MVLFYKRVTGAGALFTAVLRVSRVGRISGVRVTGKSYCYR